MAGAFMTPGAAQADVKAGVDAWARGDWNAAVAQWQTLAVAGDADAQFNMAQAYRLGRGVEQSTAKAEALYAAAAKQGHIKAADNYGLLLFQDGRREEAIPYVRAASDRGDPRAQYLLGIAHFNGDLVEKDWVRAYALLTLANQTGLPQAGPAIRQMDDFIPLDQRSEAQTLARTLEAKSKRNRASQLAAADLGNGTAVTAATPARIAANTPAPGGPAATTQADLPRQPTASGANVPRQIASMAVSPSVAAAQAAVEEAVRVTGTSTPANAGADYARSSTRIASRPSVVAAASPAATPTTAPTRQAAVRPAPAPVTSVASAAGPWRVQLGAFGVAGNADRLWTKVSRRAELSGKTRFLVPAGRLTKLQAGGFTTRSSAQATCNTLKRSGQPCIVTK
ncbi:hypothetical protein HME9302_00414 [Alteripontixanthobacter maritimus]|uniref:SPOR domain-containing protein n=1 Tax=Alteripontixanthobacter maritimus TaxID=2161824 RepID=A0A369QAB9_9SPHN|nr:hypothetical protein HME9302_00414 [Alteripontixanthobacter maritimus]